MRQVRLEVPKRGNVRTVRRLQFVAGGAELVAWVGERGGETAELHVHALATGTTVMLENELWESGEPAVSPDGRFLVAQNCYEGCHVCFEDLTRRTENRFYLPTVPGPLFGLGEFAFVPDGSELLTVRHLSRQGGKQFTRDLARFPLESYRDPQLHYEQKINPLNGRVGQVLVYNEAWHAAQVLRAGAPLPPGPRTDSVAVSADGRFFAAGDETGTVLVIELARDAVVATFHRAWPGAVKRSERAVARVAFCLGAERVVSLANGRLFADPLGPVKAWKTEPGLAPVSDFAVHPSGRFLCAACADGQARYLDARTGAVTQSFKWAKKSKPLCSVCFAPDGLTCAAGTADGRVIVWDVDA